MDFCAQVLHHSPARGPAAAERYAARLFSSRSVIAAFFRLNREMNAMTILKKMAPLRNSLLCGGVWMISFFLHLPAVSELPPLVHIEPLPIVHRGPIQPLALLPEAPEPEELSPCFLEREGICRFYNIIALAADRYEVEVPLVMAIIHTESGYNPNAVSPKGARGLMQLMPGTAESLGVVDSFDPEQNVNAGVRYFKKMLARVEGDRDLALAAYNAGLRKVREHGGIPPFPETQHYVRNVQYWYDYYKNLEDVQVPAQAAAFASNKATRPAGSY
jgi:hypothetical protein